MRRTVRQHPLQSFRFWFLILVSVAIGTAWKLDLFGNRHEHKNSVMEELPAPPEDEEEIVMVGDILDDEFDSAPEPEALDEPQELPEPAEIAAATPVNPLRETSTPKNARSARPEENPFGPANPQFVAADDSKVANERSADTHDENPWAHGAQEETKAATAVAATNTDETIRPFARNRSRNPLAEEPKTKAPTQTALLEQTEPAAEAASRRIPFRKNTAKTPEAAADEVMPVKAEAPVEPELPKGEPESSVNLAEVDAMIEDGDDVEAHRLMSQWYWNEPQSRPLFQERLDSMARSIYLQPRPHYMVPRDVQAGDVLETIAKDYNVSWQYLAKLNRTEPKRIRPGQKLKVIKGPFGAVVDLSKFELTIHAHGYYVKRYQVGIGSDNSSPVGSFKVQEKLTDPTYYGPEMEVANDDPSNPLGEYWIGLGDGYGIHGTIDPDSIGKAESKGCVRLRTEDIADVFDFLTPGSDVVIRR